MESITGEFEPVNGCHKIGRYMCGVNKKGDCIIENGTGEVMVVDYDKWFHRKGTMDDFWDENF